MIDPDWGEPEAVLPDPPNPADDEDQYDRLKKLEEEAEANDDE